MVTSLKPTESPQAWIFCVPSPGPGPLAVPSPHEVREGGTHTGPHIARTSWRTPRSGPPPSARALWPPWSRTGAGDPPLKGHAALAKNPPLYPPLCLHWRSGVCLCGDGPSLLSGPAHQSQDLMVKPPEAQLPEAERAVLTPRTPPPPTWGG